MAIRRTDIIDLDDFKRTVRVEIGTNVVTSIHVDNTKGNSWLGIKALEFIDNNYSEMLKLMAIAKHNKLYEVSDKIRLDISANVLKRLTQLLNLELYMKSEDYTGSWFDIPNMAAVKQGNDYIEATYSPIAFYHVIDRLKYRQSIQ